LALDLRQALAEDHHVVQPMDQDKWAANYDTFGARAALEVFTAVRKWNLALLAVVPPAAMSKPVTHPERGQLTFRTLVEIMAGHDLNHLKQIESIA
jgi:pyrroline-5-carboxylate reductase